MKTKAILVNMRLALGLLLCVPALWGQDIPREEYAKRRTELRKSLDGIMVLFGADEPEDLHVRFFQEPNFLYLTGWQEPGAVLMLTPKEELLFLPPHDETGEIFTGRKVAAGDEDAAAKTGFTKVLPRSAIESNFLRLLESSRHFYALEGDRRAERLKTLAVLHESADAGAAIAKLRVIKSPAEIALITKATEATVEAHLEAWKAIRPGRFEYQVAATMTNVYFDQGCERNAYAPIVGSGPNSVVLHYMANRRQMDAGELVLMDVGAECSGYASDVTRTVPVNGKFTARQREIYNIVLGAQKAAIAAIKPGMRVRGDGPSLDQIARDYIKSHGKDLHGESLGKYFTHGLSHHVGLDVHDPDIGYYETLQPGMVITIEPGIYIPEENLGVRIEDTVLVTATGAKVLSEKLPKEAAEIEKLVAK